MFGQEARWLLGKVAPSLARNRAGTRRTRKVESHACPLPHCDTAQLHLHHTQYGHLKKTGEALGGTLRSNPVLIASVRNPGSSHQSPPNRPHTRPACTQASRQVHCSPYTAPSCDTTTARISNFHKETQPHPHIFRPPSTSNVCGEALWFGMERRRPG